MKTTERGFSLLEITIVLALISLIMLIVYGMIEQTVQTTMFNESHNDLAILSQSAVNTIQAEILQTRIAFQEDAVGIAYRAALTMPPGVTVWSDSLLPIFDPSDRMQPDVAAQRYTGNALLLARQLPPLPITYDHDGSSMTPEIEFLADRYRFEYIFLARKTLSSFSESGVTLDLMMSRSGEYSDFFQLSSMSSGDTSAIVPKLIAAGLTHAWNPGQPVESAFYTLAGALDGTFDSALNNPTIPAASTETLLRGLMGGRISGRMNYSVAFQPPAPAPAFPITTPLRQFAPPNPATPGFPSGFEVKVAGPSRNRQVMTRLVLMSHYGVTRYESQQAFVVTAARF